MASQISKAKNITGNKKNAERKAVTGYPAPSRLAVPTDLKPDEVKAVAECVNPLVADAFALYTKTKNFHWHLSGSHFRDYHLLFDEQADAIFESIDILAERVRRIGGTTVKSISHISQLQTISDNNEDFVNPEDMIAELLGDNQHIARQIRKAIKTTEDNRDSPTSNLLQEQLDATERRIWFLFEVSQGGKNEM
ncbi:MAG: DNA starvation/stationary phase protection protein [Ferruginibacter sp.]